MREGTVFRAAGFTSLEMEDHSGNGVGLTNTRKRLDMVYGDRCKWKQYSDEETFRIEIHISQ